MSIMSKSDFKHQFSWDIIFQHENKLAKYLKLAEQKADNLT